MEENTIDSLYQAFYKKIARVSTRFRRYIYTDINWNNYVIGIKGARGVGKSTLIQQHIKESFRNLENVLYVSLDNLWFSTHSLTDLVTYFVAHNGTYLFLDEVHRYPNWQVVLKNLSDDFPELHVVYTGSSMLQISNNQGDMSRRQLVYDLPGLSFREFLEFEADVKLPSVTLEELLHSHNEIAMELVGRGVKILPLFERYLQKGYYPFYKRDGDGYGIRLQEVVNQVLESDLPAVDDVKYPTIQKLKKMLMILAERVPITPKMNELYAELETTREQGLKMLTELERAALLNLVSSPAKSFKQMSKPEKILINNPNLMYALAPKCEIGTVRECFFYNQLAVKHNVHYPNKGDFRVDERYLFEVGGKSKTFEQIKDIPDSYLAVDGIEIGVHNRIPLWMFGLLY
ncbi:MAG: ATP-binding protein [Paludibacteraceae bacterium]|nr:ATP-binding protein [Paludibacteraceae bacterium]